MLFSKIICYVKLFLIFLIEQYQRYLSRLLLNRCRFYPSCSEYAKQSIQTLPLYKAIWRSLIRILKCNPLFKGGMDEVKK